MSGSGSSVVRVSRGTGSDVSGREGSLPRIAGHGHGRPGDGPFFLVILPLPLGSAIHTRGHGWHWEDEGLGHLSVVSD